MKTVEPEFVMVFIIIIILCIHAYVRVSLCVCVCVCARLYVTTYVQSDLLTLSKTRHILESSITYLKTNRNIYIYIYIYNDDDDEDDVVYNLLLFSYISC